jgi:hypothetical protein
MRSNVLAAAIKATCHANLYSWYGALKADYQKRVQFAGQTSVGNFRRIISKALFIECAEVLEEARRKLGTVFSAKQLKYDRRHIRRVIPDGDAAYARTLFL